MMGKVWFITGSSRGLGLSIAKAALEAGGSVIATARKPDQLSGLVGKYGDRVFPIALDVGDNENVVKAVKAGHQHFGRIDVVVNNAGYANHAALEDFDLADFRQQIDANFYGVVYVSKAVVPILRQQGSGHIIQVSSLGGRIGTPGLSAYQAAKWAVGGFSTVLSQEMAPLGVKVTLLEPGGMKTDWAGSSMQIHSVSEPYKQTVGAFGDFLRQFSGNELSPTDKVADIVLKVSDLEVPPTRLLIGSDAVGLAKQAADSLAASDEKWHDLSVSSAQGDWSMGSSIPKFAD